jgi:ABC-type transporter Mla subunit MlaD
MAITYRGSTSSPADNGTSTATQITLTPVASMAAGDLCIVYLQQRGTATFSVGVTGGQTWQSFNRITGTNIAVQAFWCTFNGTWGANPRFDFSAGTVTTAVMHVFQPTSTAYKWYLDLFPTSGSFTAGTTPFTKTITGITTVRNSTVTIASWFTADDNTWGSLAGTGWSNSGMSAQYRNTSGSQQSSAYAYNIQSSAGATNNVSLNQTAQGGDAGITYISAFFETTEKILGYPTVFENEYTEGSGHFNACNVVATENAASINFNMYVKASSGTVNFYGILYKIVGSDYVYVAQTSSLSQGTTYAIKTFTFVTSITNGTTYAIAIFGDAGYKFRQDDTGSTNQFWAALPTTTSPLVFPSTIPTASVGLSNLFTTAWITYSTTVTTDQTITGLARMQKVVDQTITGVANIKATVDRTITGLSRIQAKNDQTITGVARMQKVVDQTIAGVSNIRATVDQVLTGVARMQKVVDQTINGISRIQKVNDAAVTGTSRMQAFIDATLTGISRIQTIDDQNITGLARMQQVVDQTLDGLARMQQVVDQAIQGVSSISSSSDQLITGLARIQVTIDSLITGISRIQAVVDQVITGVSRVNKIFSQDITAVSSIQKILKEDISGTSRIQTVVGTTISGVAMINGFINKHITGVSRIVSHIYTGGILMRWDGTQWVVAKVQRWNGAAWVDVELYRWNGLEQARIYVSE